MSELSGSDGTAISRPSYRAPGPGTLAWVTRRCDAADVIRVERLVGGISADVDRLVLRRRDVGSIRVVLRRWTDTASWTDGLVERESSALAALASSPVPAPKVLAADPSGAQAGVRCVLMSEVPGAVVLPARDPGPWLQALAETQALVHRLPAVLTARADGWFDPGSDYDWIADPGLRRAALDAATDEPQPGDDVFAHGDFQPFNLLWRAGRCSGVVDWPNAGTGPRGVDVGHCCLNLAVLYGPDVAGRYRRRYELAAGVQLDPSAVIRALLVWHPDWRQSIAAQVAGRMPLDLDPMLDRVVETIRRTLDADGAHGV